MTAVSTFNKYSGLLLAVLVSLVLASQVNAESMRAKMKDSLAEVCPEIQAFSPSKHFYKNNKPIRASSAFAAPVIGYNKVMTFGYNPGQHGPLPNNATMYAKDGTKLTRMAEYPCRTDHCGGRVVSSFLTATARRAAIRATRSPTGYVKLSKSICVEIEDIGKCYGNEVNKSRGPCAGTVM